MKTLASSVKVAVYQAVTITIPASSHVISRIIICVYSASQQLETRSVVHSSSYCLLRISINPDESMGICVKIVTSMTTFDKLLHHLKCVEITLTNSDILFHRITSSIMS
jgi:hypothetical protein